MDNLCALQKTNCKLIIWTWKSNTNFRGTLIAKPFTRFPKPITHSFPTLSFRHPSPPTPTHAYSLDNNSTNHTSLLVESFHEHKTLKALLRRLNKEGSCPLQMLQRDGDWSKDHFWAVIRFLKQSSTPTLILQVYSLLFLSLINHFLCSKFYSVWFLNSDTTFKNEKRRE